MLFTRNGYHLLLKKRKDIRPSGTVGRCRGVGHPESAADKNPGNFLAATLLIPGYCIGIL